MSAELDRWLAEHGVRLLRPSYHNRTPRPGEHLLKPVRQLIESVNDTLKGQLDLELHGGRSIEGVTARVAQRLLAMTATILHNRDTGQPKTRSLIAYDHQPDFGLTRIDRPPCLPCVVDEAIPPVRTHRREQCTRSRSVA